MAEHSRPVLPRLVNHTALRALPIETRLDLIVGEIVQAEPFAKQRVLGWMRSQLIQSDPLTAAKLEGISDCAVLARVARSYWRQRYLARRQQISSRRRVLYQKKKQKGQAPPPSPPQ